MGQRRRTVARTVRQDKRCCDRSVASLLLRHWPEDGRNDFSLGIGGFLARAGWPPEAVSHAVAIFCRHKGDPDRAFKHAQTAMESATAYYEGREARGFPWLKEALGANLATKIAKLVGYRDRIAPEPVNEDARPAITLASGKLSVTADTAEEVLITAGVPFFERSNTLVRPIIKTVDLFHGRKTETAQFAKSRCDLHARCLRTRRGMVPARQTRSAVGGRGPAPGSGSHHPRSGR